MYFKYTYNINNLFNLHCKKYRDLVRRVEEWAQSGVVILAIK